MTEWEFIKERIRDIETGFLANEGSIPTWSSQELIILINNFEKAYKSSSSKNSKLKSQS